MSDTGLGRRSAAVEGERRLITILFCDLVGSTEMSRRLDPEDYAELVLTYQERARSVIERNGGIVVNYQGDGIVAQFGYPDAHENDAERAVTSGFDLVKMVEGLSRTIGASLGETIHCRIGAHSSVSVVGRMGVDRSDMSIFGDTANIAARVQGEAAPGHVVVTRTVLDLLRGEYESIDHRRVDLRGIGEPVELARVIGPAIHGSQMVPAFHVGRTDVLDGLNYEWTQAKIGSGRAITISGPGGIGKSALIGAFLNSLGSPATVLVVRGRSLKEAEPFGVLRQVATTCLDESDRVVEGLARRVLDRTATSIDSHTTAQVRWQLAFDAGLDLLDAVAARPTVIVVEDLHWTDASTRELLERFTATISERPVLLLATTRPDTTLAGSVTVELKPLADEVMRVLVAAVGHGDLSEVLTADVVRRAQGVPLFAVELARSGRIGQGGLPDSLQASLLARLAQRPQLTLVAQVASVLGDEVDIALLATLLGAGREELDLQIRLLESLHVLELTSAESYHFVHSLLREALYGSMLRKDRRSLHHAAAEGLIAIGSRNDDRLSLVGYHLAEAGMKQDAAGCYGEAARRTARRGAFSDALLLTERGLAILGDDAPPSRELLGLTMTRGNALLAAVGMNAPGLYKLWQRCEVIAESIGDRLEQSSGMNGQSLAALIEGQYQIAIDRARRILDLGEAHSDRVALLRAHCSLALPQLYSGRVGEALLNALAAIDLYRLGDYDLVTYGFGTDQLTIAHATAAAADFFAGGDQAEDHLRAAIDHARAVRSPISLALALTQAGMLSLFDARAEAALAYSEEAGQICDLYSMPYYRVIASLIAAAASGRLGQPGASERAHHALAAARDNGRLGMTLGMYVVAVCEESDGHLDAAARIARMGVEMARACDEHLVTVELLCVEHRCRPSPAVTEEVLSAVDAARQRGADGSVQRALSLLSDLGV